MCVISSKFFFYVFICAYRTWQGQIMRIRERNSHSLLSNPNLLEIFSPRDSIGMWVNYFSLGHIRRHRWWLSILSYLLFLKICNASRYFDVYVRRIGDFSVSYFVISDVENAIDGIKKKMMVLVSIDLKEKECDFYSFANESRIETK